MMNGHAPDKIIHYTTQKRDTFVFFLPLMNHFSRQNRNAIAYKNLLIFWHISPRSSSIHTASTVSKFLKTVHIFVTHTYVFFADIQTTVQSPQDTRSVYSMPS